MTVIRFPEPAERLVIAPGCTRCSSLASSRNRIAWGNGPLNADLVVVGEAPAAGDQDAKRWQGGNVTGFAYTSRHSGRRIRDLLADAGFGHESCFFTNAVKCHPTDHEAEPREPTATERATCRRHLRREIAVVEPFAIIPTGRHATASVLAADGIELDGFLEQVLEPTKSEAFDAMVVPLLHPSYQDVWLSRIGLDRGEYTSRIRDTLTKIRSKACNQGGGSDVHES
ncbi:MAG: uracil-DNA glycosylase family protein [Salinirussus sp.]